MRRRRRQRSNIHWPGGIGPGGTLAWAGSRRLGCWCFDATKQIFLRRPGRRCETVDGPADLLLRSPVAFTSGAQAVAISRVSTLSGDIQTSAGAPVPRVSGRTAWLALLPKEPIGALRLQGSLLTVAGAAVRSNKRQSWPVPWSRTARAHGDLRQARKIGLAGDKRRSWIGTAAATTGWPCPSSPLRRTKLL